MKRGTPTTPAQQIVRRISELRDLSRRLARAGFQAGLHPYDLNRLPSVNKAAERRGTYSTRTR
jgi:hypothetical protein